MDLTFLPGQQGASINPAGQFYHPDFPFELHWTDVLKWKTSTNPYAEQKKQDTWQPKIVKDSSFLRHTNDMKLWLGHASFFFRLNGLNIIVDPVFGKLTPFTPRHSELPVSPDNFSNLDFLLVTHDHRDHCDEASIRLLLRNNPRATVVTGLGMAKVLKPWSQGQKILEMDWHQQADFQQLGLQITYLPTRHWCRRWLTDMNVRLWGAFVLETADTTIYFGGDSGYGPHFELTATLFPRIDYAFLGIGAFAPVWFMKSNHMSPADAWQAFNDLGAAKLVPMHYGTFDLSDEPIGEPERLLREIANGNEKVDFLTIGESKPLRTLAGVL
ncbi:MAG: MBL fold metallo-hydrolase [Saprospiraceae bacterium]|nr:MBL fold metallo-hydrolase [Saprospiraceae bacterium]MCF8249872.1 MBL fold metallo-hydrolase [Saprospiraceae bacterium]MCF8279458.1 MBL fold metallo-hydrolase [Bacteroidales bacterium]MCF8311694.1 MBL fold metallo-hydrolase [Saprospiraceae bacterium]MCF8440261.1 MBL fold metallo-hydrolase [Saprospiraceae bacterium]